MAERKRYAYKLIITYPEAPNLQSLNLYRVVNSNYGGIKWPRERMFFDSGAAHRRANILTDLGCTVTVVRSEPLSFPNLERHLQERDLRYIEGLEQLTRSLENTKELD